MISVDLTVVEQVWEFPSSLLFLARLHSLDLFKDHLSQERLTAESNSNPFYLQNSCQSSQDEVKDLTKASRMITHLWSLLLNSFFTFGDCWHPPLSV